MTDESKSPGLIDRVKTGLGKVEETKRIPWVTWSLFCVGIVYAIIGPLIFTDDPNSEIRIAKGGEMALLASGRFLLTQRTVAFMRTLVVLGWATPVALMTAAIAYGADGLLSYVGIVIVGLLPAVVLVRTGLAGLKRHHQHPRPPQDDPAWVQKIDLVFKATLGLMIALFSGLMDEAGAYIVPVVAIIYLGGMLALAWVRVRLTRRDIGTILGYLGLSAIVVPTALGLAGLAHISIGEGLLGVVPGALMVFAGRALQGHEDQDRPT